MVLLFIELLGYSFTAVELVVAVVTFVVGVSALLKAYAEIRKLGWQPFKAKWITPRQARRQRMDELIDRFDDLQLRMDERGLKIDRIDAELRTNGGSSLKDYIVGIDSKVEHIQARVRHQDETSPVPIFTLNEEGEIVSANSAFRELLNADENELAHSNYLARIEGRDRTRLIQELKEAIEYKMPLDSTVHFKTDGPHFTAVRLQASPDVRPGGQLMGFFGIASRA